MTHRKSSSYTRLSVALHWISGFLLIALFVTHAGDDESILPQIHVAIGPITGLILLLRVFYRLLRGLPRPDNEEDARTTPATLAIYLLLLAIVLMVVSGYLLPWTQGASVNLLGLQFAAPFYIDPLKYSLILSVHKVSAYSLAPLLLLHILLSKVPERMFETDADGY